MNETTKKRTFWTLLLIAFIDNLSVGILLPLVPLLLTSRAAGISILPNSMTDAQGYILFGYLLAIYTIAQFFATPILGRLSDHFGRKPILMVSIAGTCIAYLIFGYGVVIHNIPLLFIARFFDGLTGGNISVAQAAIADISEQKERAKMYGLFGGALGVGFALGPIIGAFFSNSHFVPWFNATTPFWVTAGLSGLSVVAMSVALTETLQTKIQDVRLTILESITSITKVFQLGKTREFFLGVFVWRTGFGFWTTFAVVYLVYRFGLNQSQLGSYFLFVGIWLILGQLFLVRWVAKRWSEEKVLTACILFSAIVFLSYLIPHNWHVLFWIIPFLGTSTALAISNIPAAVAKVAEAGKQGEYAGMSNSVQSLALSISPILSGYISATLNPISVIVLSSILMFVAAVIFFDYRVKNS